MLPVIYAFGVTPPYSSSCYSSLYKQEEAIFDLLWLQEEISEPADLRSVQVA